MCAKNSSAEEISVATRQTHLPVTQSFPFMAPLYLCIWQGKTDFSGIYTQNIGFLHSRNTSFVVILVKSV